MTQSKTMIRDLTQGSVARQLILFSIPFVFSNLLQMVYSLTDMVIIGQFVGSGGLSAVSNGGEITHLFTSVCIGFSGAGQVLIAQYVGKGDRDAISRTVGTMFTFTLGAALVITAITVPCTDLMLNWMNIPLKAWEHAHDYVLFCMLGMFFIYGYNVVAAILRGMGDSTRPMIFVIIAVCINVVLDLLFVAVFEWGAKGAALATVIGQAFSFLYAMFYLYRRRDAFGFDFRPRSFIPNLTSLKLLLRVGLPLAIQHVAVCFSILVVNAWVNAYGVVASAVGGVGGKLSTVASVITMSLNTAGSSLVGQNMGAGRPERADRALRVCMVVAMSFSLLLSLAMYFFPRQIFSLWSSDPAVLDLAESYVWVAVINFFGFAIRCPVLTLTNGLGFASLSFSMGVLDGVVARLGLAWLMGVVMEMGVHGYWYGSAIAGWVFILLWPYWFSGRWKKRRLPVDRIAGNPQIKKEVGEGEK